MALLDYILKLSPDRRPLQNTETACMRIPVRPTQYEMWLAYDHLNVCCSGHHGCRIMTVRFCKINLRHSLRATIQIDCATDRGSERGRERGRERVEKEYG